MLNRFEYRLQPALFSLPPKGGTQNASLYLLYLNFGITLSVALFALVLFAAFLFEDDDLFAAAMADNGGLDGRSTDTAAGNERFDIDLIAFFAFNRRHADHLTFRHRKLLSARPDNCVTHYVISDIQAENELPVEKCRLYGKLSRGSNKLETGY